VSDWQAALVGYFLALVVAQTEAAPIAVAVSWGTAIFLVLDQAASGGNVFSSIIQQIQTGVASQPNVGTVGQGQLAGQPIAQSVPASGPTVQTPSGPVQIISPNTTIGGTP
jgi:hypothetical protein